MFQTRKSDSQQESLRGGHNPVADMIRKASLHRHHVLPVAITPPGNTANARNLPLRNVPERLLDKPFHLFASCGHATASVAAV